MFVNIFAPHGFIKSLLHGSQVAEAGHVFPIRLYSMHGSIPSDCRRTCIRIRKHHLGCTFIVYTMHTRTVFNTREYPTRLQKDRHQCAEAPFGMRRHTLYNARMYPTRLQKDLHQCAEALLRMRRHTQFNGRIGGMFVVLNIELPTSVR